MNADIMEYKIISGPVLLLSSNAFCAALVENRLEQYPRMPIDRYLLG